MASIHETHGSGLHLFHRRLPPLHALTVFAAAAASGSFSRAADLLFVTQGAVSRQIRQLAKYLGCPLFVRHKRGLKLTAEGQLLLPVVDDALGRMVGACDNLRTPADLLALPLLHCDPLDGWARWLHAVGVDNRDARRGQTFDTLELVLAAATRGRGVAIGDLNLVRESLRDGVLVAPFPQTLEQGLSYYLVYPPDRAQQPKIRVLREWLTASAGKP